MSQPTSPYLPDQPAEATTATPPPKRSRLWLIVVGLAALIVIVGSAVGITLAAASGGTAPTAQTAWDREQQNRKPVVVETTPAPGPTPTASDFELTPKITDKECFGSAGCNVSLEVKVGYSGPTISEDDTWRVTYEVSGVQDGPQIGSFELTGTSYDVNEENVSTTNSKAKVTVKVTGVEKVGL